MTKSHSRFDPRPLAYLLATIVLIFAAWKLALISKLVSETVLPAPAIVFQLAWQELSTGKLLEYIQISGQRLVAGFFFGSLLGVLIGALLGSYRILRLMFLPLCETLRPIPPLAWIPLALIWFGIGEESKIFLIALTSFFPVFITTLKGVQQIDFNLLRAARSLDMNHRQMFFLVTLPAALPDIVTGLRLGWSIGLVALVGAEMIASTSGLGFLIMNGMNNGRFDEVILGILVIGAISIVTDLAFIQFSKTKLLRWHNGLEKNGN
ncbi:MAG TPA: ABC transporter permease [Eoetvoesiella sp.]|uniref:ABC transporter permease n=1 Tax=Eoetvoesiella sp. TaxID=1966355 RepID=UPI002C5098CF|nr:ABC transporter permease [Eoetvoesiella sp.]HWK61438.1 ABC transporter permease [Eoetvoesiella sp.]